MAGWPEHIVEQFSTVTLLGEVDETEYYGPYNGLLLDQFPGPEHYMIVPQYKRPRYPQSIDFTTIFIVQRHKHPIFFIEIKPAGHIKSGFAREAADGQMRQQFEALVDQLTIPTLYGISALGTQLCVYTYDKETRALHPKRIDKDLKRIIDRAPANRWDIDLMTPAGAVRIRELVAHVKALCAEL
jgi:hypothetical protein